ncbi:MAG: LemA protein [Thermoplasmata archaeon]|jgi:LemA protein|nr:LemA protein [Thermoplasmata archaeon]
MVKGTYVALGILAAIALIAVGVVGAGIAAYNSLNRSSIAVDAQGKDVDVIYQRNFQLLPQLDSIATRYFANETAVQEQVAALRSGITAAQNGSLTVKTNLTEQLNGLVAVLGSRAESYPQLKGDQLFITLQDETTNSANKLAAEKLRYNDLAQAYNTERNTCCFPILVAHMTGFAPKEYIGYNDRPNQESFPAGQGL